MALINAHVERLQTARDTIVGLRLRAEATPPPPDETANAHPWVAREILAHAAEMLPYWMGEIERVLAADVEPAPFGRTAADPVRTMTVDRDRSLPLAELYSRIASSVDRVGVLLLQIDDSQCARRAVHETLGEMSLEQLVERFLSGHLEEHCRQLEIALGK
ncbi:MAG: hypothetical protein ACHQ01_11190 [Candidatus Limnocylindrales bacterium]